MCHLRYIQYPCSHEAKVIRTDFCKEFWTQPPRQTGCPLGRPPTEEFLYMGKAEAALLAAVDGATKSWKRKLGPFFGRPFGPVGCDKCYNRPITTELGNLVEQERLRKWLKLCDMVVQAKNDKLCGKPVEDEEMQKKVEIAHRLCKITVVEGLEGKTPLHDMTTPFEVMFMLFNPKSESGEGYSTFNWEEYEASKIAAANAAKAADPEAAETQDAAGPENSEHASA
ncbi:MAG: hypothetical protein Q9202_007049 [Teloschistes flavicans]